MFCKEFLAKSSFMQTITQDSYSLCQPPNMCLQEGRSKTLVQGELCTICKNRAPHVNFCHPVVLKSYGSKVSKKIGWHFFKPGSRSFQGHIISNV